MRKCSVFWLASKLVNREAPRTNLLICQHLHAGPYQVSRHTSTKLSSDAHLHVDGIPERLAVLTDADLEVEGMQLPTHKAVLAAASPVFADLFAASADSATTADLQTTRLSVALTGHTQTEVQAALRFLYKHCALGLAEMQSKYTLHSADFARPILQFAHKYDFKGILKDYEVYLDAKIKEKPGVVFVDAETTVAWAALAEQCGLNMVLAHAELHMLSNRDPNFWKSPAFVNHALSRDSMLRMLRAGQDTMIRRGFGLSVSQTQLLQWQQDSIGSAQK